MENDISKEEKKKKTRHDNFLIFYFLFLAYIVEYRWIHMEICKLDSLIFLIVYGMNVMLISLMPVPTARLKIKKKTKKRFSQQFDKYKRSMVGAFLGLSPSPW